MKHQTAFLLIPVGGVGQQTFDLMYGFEGMADRQIPFSTVCIDTDVIDDRRIDFPCQLQMSPDILKVLYGNPNRFGSVIPKLKKTLADRLEPDQLNNGARTTRPITQLSFAYNSSSVAYQLRRAVKKLNQEFNPKTILPIMFSSSGGGSGSALQVLLANELTKRRFRQKVLYGISEWILERPISFVGEPFSEAENAATDQASLILANAMAFRLETEWLLKHCGAYQLIFHECFSNDSGTTIDSRENMCRLLATSIVEIIRNWTFFKARLVDPSVVAVNRRTNFENEFGELGP